MTTPADALAALDAAMNATWPQRHADRALILAALSAAGWQLVQFDESPVLPAQPQPPLREALVEIETELLYTDKADGAVRCGLCIVDIEAEQGHDATCAWERIRAALATAQPAEIDVERLARAYTLLISSVPALLRSHRDSPSDTARRLNASLHDAVVDWCVEFQKATGRGDQGLVHLREGGEG